jgi:hypothetical protein
VRITLGLFPIEFQIAARVGFLAFAVFGFTACASVSSFSRSADSLLPIETVDASSGRIVSARAFETSDKLYVAGEMQKLFGYNIPPAAHVDIQLINGDRGIIAEKQDSIREISPREQNARNRLYSYVASFPLGDCPADDKYSSDLCAFFTQGPSGPVSTDVGRKSISAL